VWAFQRFNWREAQLERVKCIFWMCSKELTRPFNEFRKFVDNLWHHHERTPSRHVWLHISERSSISIRWTRLLLACQLTNRAKSITIHHWPLQHSPLCFTSSFHHYSVKCTDKKTLAKHWNNKLIRKSTFCMVYFFHLFWFHFTRRDWKLGPCIKSINQNRLSESLPSECGLKN
jgi:hypothetical protein